MWGWFVKSGFVDMWWKNWTFRGRTFLSHVKWKWSTLDDVLSSFWFIIISTVNIAPCQLEYRLFFCSSIIWCVFVFFISSFLFYFLTLEVTQTKSYSKSWFSLCHHSFKYKSFHSWKFSCWEKVFEIWMFTATSWPQSVTAVLHLNDLKRAVFMWL